MLRATLGALAVAFFAASMPASTPVEIGLTSTPVEIGPPWISIEHPVNPYDASTRDAFLLVHAFHHGTPVNFPVTGTAEGFVKGERKTVNLQFTPTSRSGVYAVKRQWDTRGEWTLVISVEQARDDRVTAIVDLTRGGSSVTAVRVPTQKQGIHRIPATVSIQDVDASLRKRAMVAVGR